MFVCLEKPFKLVNQCVCVHKECVRVRVCVCIVCLRLSGIYIYIFIIIQFSYLCISAWCAPGVPIGNDVVVTKAFWKCFLFRFWFGLRLAKRMSLYVYIHRRQFTCSYTKSHFECVFMCMSHEFCRFFIQHCHCQGCCVCALKYSVGGTLIWQSVVRVE